MNKKFLKIKQKKSNPTNPLYVIVFIILIIYLIGLLVPLIFGVFISFINPKVYQAYQNNPLSWPTSMNFNNYINGFKAFTISPTGANKLSNSVGMLEIMLYSVLYAGGCAFMATLTPFVVSYLVARFNYKFSNFIYTLVLIVMAVPIVGNLASEILVAKKIGVFDHIWGQWIMKTNFLGMYFLVFYAIFKGIPKDYTEAAKIDGASNFKIMTKIIFPFAIGTFGIVFLLNFINFWNDYQTPYYYLDSFPTVGVSIFHFQANIHQVVYYVGNKKMYGLAPQLFAMIFMAAAPVITLAIVFNRKLMGNLSDGGVKE